MTSPDRRVSVVIATRNRPQELSRTLDRLAGLDPRPPVIVVDNASDTGLSWVVDHPARPRLIRLDRNRAGAGRTVGAAYAATPYVAFCDDDSWWAPGALTLAADLFDRHPRLALVAARTLVDGRPDPVTEAMDSSPLSGDPVLPGRPVLGCLACASVVRRSAFLDAGGFSELLFIGGEESLLCYDLAAAGWGVRYVPELTAYHAPSPHRVPSWRRALERRNVALVAWMRRPLPVAAAASWRLVRDSLTDPVARAALLGLLRGLPTALADRRRLPPAVERDVRLLQHAR